MTDRDTLRAKLMVSIDRYTRDILTGYLSPDDAGDYVRLSDVFLLLDALCTPTPEPHAKIGETLGLSENLTVVPRPDPSSQSDARCRWTLPLRVGPSGAILDANNEHVATAWSSPFGSFGAVERATAMANAINRRETAARGDVQAG